MSDHPETAYPTADELDLDAIAMCDAALVSALADGETLLADYLFSASEWHADQIESRRSARIGRILDAMAEATGRVNDDD